MSPTLEATQTGADTFEVAIRPDGGVPATLYIVPIPGPGTHWYVKAQPGGTGFISRHTTFERAVKSGVHRAKRYLASYNRSARHRAVAA